MTAKLIFRGLKRTFYQLQIVFFCLFVNQVQAVTVTDDRGVEVFLPEPAAKVATISTFGADLVTSLGLIPVAISSFGPFARPDYLGSQLQSVPVIGTRAQANMELLSEVRPDLILAIRRYTEKNATQFESIAPYIALNLVTLEDSLKGVEIGGKALGKEAEAQRLNQEFQTLLAEYRGKAPGGVSAALLVTSSETPFIYYDHFLTAKLLTELKARNIGASSPTPTERLPLGFRIGLEQLLEEDPDVIFLFDSNKKRAFTLNPIWSHLRAVREGRVYEVGHHWKEGAGPTARVLMLQEMAHRLYPDLFEIPALADHLKSRSYQ